MKQGKRLRDLFFPQIQRGLIACFFAFFFLAFLIPIAQAQTPITASGLNTQISGPVSVNGSTQYNITGGTRPGSGANLFHSFGQFNIPSNNIANFLNETALPTNNILARVTGGNLSSIYGTIQTEGFGNANLFLINPTGFLFGPNATVNVGGMLAFTSADYLRLADGNLFNAVPNPTADAMLSTAPVAAYGFLGSNPVAITVQGSQLAVTPGQSISLVGGNITVQSGVLEDGVTIQPALLTAPGGQINLASVASPGEILTGTLAQAPNMNGQSFGNLGAIQISEQSAIDVSGNGGGTVSIRGGQFVLDSAIILANVTAPGPLTSGVESTGRGVDIAVSQDAVIQSGAIIDTSITGNATPGMTYGGIHVQAHHIEASGILDLGAGIFVPSVIQSNVAAESLGGNSGDIELQAGSILLKNFVSLNSETASSGGSGNITLESTGNLQADNVAFINTGATESGSGIAGNIDLISSEGDVLLTNGSFISSQSSVFGSGTVGSIAVNAPKGTILLTGSPDTGPTTLFTSIDGTGPNGGKGGIQLTSRNLMIENSGIQIDNFTSFQPGDLNVNLTGTLSMSGAEIFPSTLRTTTRREARSADLNITAPAILLTDGSHVDTETFRSGDAGTLNIFTEDLQVLNGAQIRSSSRFNPVPDDPITIPAGGGGTITIQGLASTAQSVLIDGPGSGIFTDTEGTGAGGNIFVRANSVTLSNGGTLSAATSGTASSATGGTITVNAEHVTLNSQAVITADTNGIAPAGTVDINTGTLAINSGGQIRSSSGAETEQVSALAFSLTAAPPLTGGTISIQGQNGNGSQADSVTIDGAGSGVFTQSTGSRPGGDINILTGQSVAMTNNGSISASSTGTGNAGNININAGNQLKMTNSTVTTEANRASGGAIKITTTPSGMVELTNSAISASVLDGTGGGGSVDIDPQFVILQNSQITADAESGPGGNIFITTNLLLPDSTSRISASSQFGQQGSVTIQSPASPASGKINPIGQRPLIPTSMVSQRCAALAGGNVSSFTVAGRDSLPAEPGSWLPSPLALVDSLSGSSGLSSFSSSSEQTHETNKIDKTNQTNHDSSSSSSGLSGLSSYSDEANKINKTNKINQTNQIGLSSSSHETNQINKTNQTNGVPLLSLRQISPAGFLIQGFAPNGSTDCAS